MEELLKDFHVIRLSIEALNKRVQEQDKPVSVANLEAALATVLATVRAQPAPRNVLDYMAIAQQIQGHLATPAALGAVLTTATNELSAVVERIPSTVPVEGEVLGFTNWKSAALVFFVPMLVLLLGMAMGGQFSQVSKADFDALQAQNNAIQAKSDTIQERNELLNEENLFYINRIKRYVAKNKKAAGDFPAYRRSE